ncbi:MAG: tol-pal system YbgF family protein [Gemmataceae bacterium]
MTSQTSRYFPTQNRLGSSHPGLRKGQPFTLVLSLCMSLALAMSIPVPAIAQSGDGSDDSQPKSDLALVERLLVARREYRKTLEKLRAFYIEQGTLDKAKWAEEELIGFHRVTKRAFRLELDVPPPTLRGKVNVLKANRLYILAMGYKGKGWGSDYTDNQRRAELLLRQLITQYPQSNRISDAAYQLGDLYEKKPYQHYKRAALYFERCYQWNPMTQFDARLRAARIYDKNLLNRDRAIDIYKEAARKEADQARVEEALGRIKELRNQQ